MEIVNVKNVIIKYVPEHIVVETYILSSNSEMTARVGRRIQHSSTLTPTDYLNPPNEHLDEFYYTPQDDSLNPETDDDEKLEFVKAESPKEFTEEEYLELDYSEMFVEDVGGVENEEIVEIEEKPSIQFTKQNSMQLLKEWFFSHLNYPYPTEKEKELFCELTNKSLIQINNWFTNMRKRNKDKINNVKQETLMTKRNIVERVKVDEPKLPKKIDLHALPVNIKTEIHLSESHDFSRSANDQSQLHHSPTVLKKKRHTATSLDPKTPAICDICGKTFAQRRMLLCHLKRHDPSKWDKCEICNKSFPDGLKRHMRTHSGERPFICEQCGASYTQSFALKMHKASHENSGDEYYCDICKNGKAYRNRFKFKYHVRAHFLEKTMRTCEICGFKTNNMKSHTITRHSTLRPFKCETCNETFKFKAVYRTHLLIHSESTPYACDQCDKTFKAEYSLVRHKVVHSEEKNFICSICNKAFLLQRYLSKHMKGHTGTRKRHACTECSKDYSNVTDRRRHMEKEHGIVEIPNPKYANNKMKKKSLVPCAEN